LTETEKIQRRFAFLREHGGIVAGGRIRDGAINWRFRR
jgi:hypothetical protein